MSTPEVTFNVVWTGSSFTYLRTFVASQLDRSDARFRFVANGCAPGQVEAMEAFAARHPGRVVEVLDVSPTIVAHGVALETVRTTRHDGELFCLIDPDIKANGRFVEPLAGLLGGGCVAVSSATEVWSDDNIQPAGHKGVAGEHFFDVHGYVFGGPHLTFYDRAALDETCDRWGVFLGSVGPDIPPATRERLAEVGHHYVLYDTGKVVNILLQVDGGAVVHEDLDEIVHIGGMSHYLDPYSTVVADDGTDQPDWSTEPIVRDRYLVTRYTAAVLRAGVEGRAVPAPPVGVAPSMEAKMVLVRDEVVDLLERYRDW